MSKSQLFNQHIKLSVILSILYSVSQSVNTNVSEQSVSWVVTHSVYLTNPLDSQDK